MVEKMLIHNFFSHKGKRRHPDQTRLVRISSFPLMREKIVNQHFFDHFFQFFWLKIFFRQNFPPSQIVPRFQKTHLENRAVQIPGWTWQRLSECTLTTFFLKEPSCGLAVSRMHWKFTKWFGSLQYLLAV